MSGGTRVCSKGTLVGFGSRGAFLRSTNETIRLGYSLLPRDINDSDQVVGLGAGSAFLWQDGVMSLPKTPYT